LGTEKIFHGQIIPGRDMVLEISHHLTKFGRQISEVISLWTEIFFLGSLTGARDRKFAVCRLKPK